MASQILLIRYKPVGSVEVVMALANKLDTPRQRYSLQEAHK